MKLEARFKEVRLRKGLAESTEEAYWMWAKDFINYWRERESRWVYPNEWNESHVEKFLTHLAVDRNVSASTQNQAFSALLFLYRDVLGKEFANVKALRAKPKELVPVVYSEDEVCRLFTQLRGVNELIAKIQYGAGLRIGEAVELRVKDIDIDRLVITICNAKGGKDRYTILPPMLVDPLRQQIERVKYLHALDVREGFACVALPDAFARKSPNAAASLAWAFLFPSQSRCLDKKTGKIGRFHVHKSAVQRAIKLAGERAGITKRVKSHGLRHSFSTHLLESGQSIETVRDLLGHKDISTTQIYLHAVTPAHTRVKSPLEKALSRELERPKLRRIG